MNWWIFCTILSMWMRRVQSVPEVSAYRRYIPVSAVCQLAEKMHFTMEQAMNTLGIDEKEQKKLFELWKSRGEHNHE